MKTRLPSTRPRGFALVVALSLMILLTILAVGLLTLSSSALRVSPREMAQATARQNARLALMMALGELQKGLGPDRAISAPSSAVTRNAAQPNLLGVWSGFGWLPPAGAVPAASEKATKFKSWLVSTRSPESAGRLEWPGQAPTADAVWLVNPATTGTLDAVDNSLKAERVPLASGKLPGGFAWAVSDNSTRAPLNLTPVFPDSIANNLSNRSAASAPRPEVLHESFARLTNRERLWTLATASMLLDSKDRIQITARARSLTHSSIGLLCDPVSGGLKTDLTPLMEGGTALNLATILGRTSPYFPTSATATGHGSPTWDYLRSHYQLYKRMTAVNTGKPRLRLSNTELAPKTSGYQPKPSRAALLPVIAKLQIVFSLVSHHSHIGDRVSALNTIGVPLGNLNHAVPHLVYDPVVTLYNPYDTELELSQLRIRISDPPVGFQFMKHDLGAGTNAWVRPEFEGGEFHGLGRFQITNETNPDARKFFSLYLRNRTSSGNPGGNVVLMPGEVKVFSAWVEKNWTWGLETSGGYVPRAFFDHSAANRLGEQDYRTGNKRGVEGMPGLDFRAGLQTDHLSYGIGRPASSIYSWERPPLRVGWVSMKLTDDVTVNARPQRCVRDASQPDFRVDLMAGLNDAPESDLLRTFEFRFADVAKELTSAADASGVITRRFKNSSILQKPEDKGTGGKSPFAIFTMTAKTTRDARDDSKSWLFNNLVTEGGSQDSRTIGNAAQSYDLRLDPLADFTSFPGIEYDDMNQRGYFGAIADANQGVSIVPMYRAPLIPAASLGDWVASNLVSSSLLPRVNQPFGNSHAHPLIPSGQIELNNPVQSGSKMLDHSYLLNASLWDSFYFSSATNCNSAAFDPPRTRAEVIEDFFLGKKPMLNARLVPWFTGDGSAADLSARYQSMAEAEFSKRFAANAAIQGAFNINSDSADAWRALLSSLRDNAVIGYAKTTYPNPQKTAFVRAGLPVASSADEADPRSSVNALGQIRWAGFRSLTDDEIRKLAGLIVEEIRARGTLDKAPSLSVADFVNRRPGGTGELHALKGILQTAIDRSGINDKFHPEDSNTITAGNLKPERIRGLANPAALEGYTADGAAPMLTQADLLAGIAPVITARGDTFTIRAYGEARSANGNQVEASAWCEATVQRLTEYVDPANPPAALVNDLGPLNQRFGRRFVVLSFRWLNPKEV